MTHSTKETISALDGIRGIACLLVVLSHMAEYIPGCSHFFRFSIALGSPGVALFFSLSGFLMAHLYLKKPFSIKLVSGYAIARFSRIVPAYWIAILLCFFIHDFVASDFSGAVSINNIVRHVFFLGSAGVFWSIPPEIQYYMFFIFIWYAWFSYCKAVYWPAVLVFLLACVMILTRHDWPGILLPSKLHLFLSGCLTAVFFDYIRPRVKFTQTVIIMMQLVSLVALIIGIFALKGVDYYQFYNYSLFFLFVMWLLFAFSFDSLFSNLLFGNGALRWLGHVSFSVYLFHGLVLYAGGKLTTVLQVNGLAVDGVLLLSALLIPGLFSKWIELPLCRVCKNKLSCFVDRRLTMHSQKTLSVRGES